MKAIKTCLIVVSLFALFSCEKESEQNSFEFTKSAWDKAKQTAKDVWKEVKPIVKADAKGAATGAMVGLAGGAAGVGGGAVIRACVDSAGKCIDNILQ